MPYDIFEELASGNLPHKPMNAFIFIVGLFMSATSFLLQTPSMVGHNLFP
jgi:hypothetical protein